MPLSFQENTFVRASRALLAVFSVISVVLMGMYVTEGDSGLLHRVQAGFHEIISPVEYASLSASHAVEGVGGQISDANADPQTMSELIAKNAELTATLTQSEEYRLEAQRLQELLNLKDVYKIEGVSARVIGRSSDAWNQTVTLDVGEDEGVTKGLTVMGGSGVIGQVISTAASSCTVRLISDPKSGVAAILQSNRADGVVRGSLAGTLYLENIPADVEVQVGDVVLTSGLGGSYTKGLLIGTVVRVEGKANDGTRQIVVSPNQQVDSLEEVIVVFSASASLPSNQRSQASSSASTDADGQDDSGEGAEDGE